MASLDRDEHELATALKQIGQLSAEVRSLDGQLQDLYRRRVSLYRRALDLGATKGAVAQAAQVTDAAVTLALRKLDAPAGQDDDENVVKVHRPSRSASRAAWVEYALASGADLDELEGFTRDDLVAEYGQD